MLKVHTGCLNKKGNADGGCLYTSRDFCTQEVYVYSCVLHMFHMVGVYSLNVCLSDLRDIYRTQLQVDNDNGRFLYSAFHGYLNGLYNQ
jgi:hypothetical protein